MLERLYDLTKELIYLSRRLNIYELEYSWLFGRIYLRRDSFQHYIPKSNKATLDVKNLTKLSAKNSKRNGNNHLVDKLVEEIHRAIGGD